MQQLTNVDFVAASLPTTRDVIDMLAIRTHPPHGSIVWHLRRNSLVAEIGKLVAIDGVIHVIPKCGTGECHRRYLLGAAEAAFFGDFHEELGWRRDASGSRWDTWVSMPAADARPIWADATRTQLGLPTLRTA